MSSAPLHWLLSGRPTVGKLAWVARHGALQGVLPLAGASKASKPNPSPLSFCGEQRESSPRSKKLLDNAIWQKQVLFEFANVPYLLPSHWASAEKLTSRFIGDNSTLAFWSAQHHLQTLGPIIAKFHVYGLKRAPLTYDTFDVISFYLSTFLIYLFISPVAKNPRIKLVPQYLSGIEQKISKLNAKEIHPK